MSNTTARKRTRMCNCISKINKKLEAEKSNTRVTTALLLNFKTGKERCVAKIQTEKADSRKREKAKPIIPSYCPFCGEEYPK